MGGEPALPSSSFAPVKGSTARFLVPSARAAGGPFSSSTLAVLQKGALFALFPFLHPVLFGMLFAYPALIPLGLAPPLTLAYATRALRRRTRAARMHAEALALWAERHLEEDDPLARDARAILARTDAFAFRAFSHDLVAIEAATAYLEERARRA